jgi:putative transposase
MARAWRIEYEGACYHLLSRGNERREIFVDDDDRGLFLDTLGECSERFELEVFAYVLMSNHYHLLVRSQRANLSRALHWFSGTYTRRFNNRHGRSGHLFQGRFKSMLVENDAYILQLSCYIHRNPLRAGLVKRLADYPWSSYLAYAYGRRIPPWLSIEPMLSQFKKANPRRAYRQKVQRYADEETRLWEDFRHGFILGSKEFVKSIRSRFLPEHPAEAIPQQRRLARDQEFPDALQAVSRRIGCDLSRLLSGRRLSGVEKEKRDLLIYWTWKSGRFTNAQIGQFFGLTYSAVSHCVQGMKTKLGCNRELGSLLEQINSQYKL